MANKNGDANRADVRDFFDWVLDAKGLLKAGVLCLLFSLVAVSCEWYAAGVVAALTGALILYYRSRKKHTLGKLYASVERAKRNDFARVLQRSYDKLGTDVRFLLSFEMEDTLEELSAEAARDRSLFEDLIKKSVFLAGIPEKPTHFKRILLDGRLIEVFSPIPVTIIYLTATELIIYGATVDIRAGDLPSEDVRRLNLRDIVEIQTFSSTVRFTRASDPDLFAKYEKWTKTTQSTDLVVRRHGLRVTRMDGHTTQLPVGVTSYQSGDRGVLDGAQFSEEKIERFASEIVARIKDVRAGAGDALASSSRRLDTGSLQGLPEARLDGRRG